MTCLAADTVFCCTVSSVFSQSHLSEQSLYNFLFIYLLTSLVLFIYQRPPLMCIPLSLISCSYFKQYLQQCIGYIHRFILSSILQQQTDQTTNQQYLQRRDYTQGLVTAFYIYTIWSKRSLVNHQHVHFIYLCRPVALGTLRFLL